MAQYYDAEQKRVRNHLDECSDIIGNSPAYKAKLEMYHSCMKSGETEFVSVINKFYHKFLELDKHY